MSNRSVAGPVFDSHCHLDFIYQRYKIPVQEFSLSKTMTDDRIQPHYFEGCITNFCHPSAWDRHLGKKFQPLSVILDKAVQHNKVFLTLGTHPHWSRFWNEAQDSQLRTHVENCHTEFGSKLVAIGETGLDFSKNNKKHKTTKEMQERAFRGQIKIALDFQIPLVLHIRSAEDEGLSVLERCAVPRTFPMHRHCFTGSLAQAEYWLEHYTNSCLGLTGLITMTGPRSDEARELAAKIPLGRLLVETDAPHFKPPDVIGKCAYPTDALAVAKEIAKIKQVPLVEVLRQNVENVKRTYQICF